MIEQLADLFIIILIIFLTIGGIGFLVLMVASTVYYINIIRDMISGENGRSEDNDKCK